MLARTMTTKHTPRPPANKLEEFSRDAERTMLRAALEHCAFNLSETARFLGMTGPSGTPQAGTVSRKIADLGLRDWFDENRAK